ncbi:SpoIID/LytB domain protein [Thermaerobacter marianensis DSM 12885]|uniref:SpoIID/LytB domain protein n=1 Tax=Thermaerobacter marianensis (strain ATCC 700841 / DSM 12885 / JCM 10246 / 7p75a) TaxID=644966 RepID=E6SHR5_THEM7|nr:SpoIID/LytB domain protein [Thermaerobacter marianensis DSM 12885]
MPAVKGAEPARVRHAEGFTQLPGGGWGLQERAGRLQVHLPQGASAVTFVLPEDGPVLLAPPGYQVRIIAAVAGGLVHEVIPPEGTETVDLQFAAVPGQTSRLQVGPIGVKPLPRGGVDGLGVSAAQLAGRFRLQAAGDPNGSSGETSGGATPPGDAGASADQPAADPALAWVRFFGGGNGHRTGLSQFGAQGLALLGVGYRDILVHYFPGTRLEKRVSDTAQRVRVGLSLDEQGIGNSAPVPRLLWKVEVPEGTTVAGASTRPVPPGVYAITYNTGSTASGSAGGTGTGGTGSGSTANLPPGFVFDPQGNTPGEPFVVAGTKPSPSATTEKIELIPPPGQVLVLHYPYTGCDPKKNHAYQGCRRYEGRLEFETAPVTGGTGIVVRNILNLQQYLNGVVPHEMPASWGKEALKAQTVAARTFAARQNFGLDQNLVDSTYDQVFYGRYEDGTPTGVYEKKIAGVVQATDGQVLTYNGNLAAVFYSSANGGWIASNTEAFGDGTGTPLAYLTGREDRFQLADGTMVTPESYWYGNKKYEATYFRWQRDIAVSVVEQKWPEIGRLQSIEVVKRSPTWTVLEVQITGSAGSKVVTGRQLRSALGLPSTMLLPDKLYPRVFYDVPMDSPLGPEINRAFQLNLISGDVYANFKPAENLTRAAFVKMLVNAVETSRGVPLAGPDEDPATEDEPFSDVHPEQALYVYVVKAFKAGWIQGYDAQTFGYDLPIKRQEAAAVIARALKLQSAPAPFDDVPSTSAFAGAIGAVYQAEIMRGYPGGTKFGPGQTMNRGEAAAAAALRSYGFCVANGC